MSVGYGVAEHTARGVEAVLVLEIVRDDCDTNDGVGRRGQVILDMDFPMPRFLSGPRQIDVEWLSLIRDSARNQGTLIRPGQTGDRRIDPDQRIPRQRDIGAGDRGVDPDVRVVDRRGDQLSHRDESQAIVKGDRIITRGNTQCPPGRVLKFERPRDALIVENREGLAVKEIRTRPADHQRRTGIESHIDVCGCRKRSARIDDTIEQSWCQRKRVRCPNPQPEGCCAASQNGQVVTECQNRSIGMRIVVNGRWLKHRVIGRSRRVSGENQLIEVDVFRRCAIEVIVVEVNFHLFASLNQRSVRLSPQRLRHHGKHASPQVQLERLTMIGQPVQKDVICHVHDRRTSGARLANDVDVIEIVGKRTRKAIDGDAAGRFQPDKPWR